MSPSLLLLSQCGARTHSCVGDAALRPQEATPGEAAVGDHLKPRVTPRCDRKSPAEHHMGFSMGTK